MLFDHNEVGELLSQAYEDGKNSVGGGGGCSGCLSLIGGIVVVFVILCVIVTCIQH